MRTHDACTRLAPRSSRFLVGLLPLAAALLGLGAGSRAQEPAGPTLPPPRQEPEEPRIPENLFSPDPLQQELLQLFQRVERNLESITDRLSQVGAGEAPLEEVGDSGIEQLLRATQSSGGEVIEDIGRILEIAQQLESQMSSGSGQSEPRPEGQSPLDQERDSGPRQRENTPQGPRQEGEQQPQPSTNPEGEPKGPLPNPPGGENRPGTPNDPERGEPVPRGDDSERWGFLPERDREVFRNQGGDDLPAQYRDFIDAYYRRLNQTP